MIHVWKPPGDEIVAFATGRGALVVGGGVDGALVVGAAVDGGCSGVVLKAGGGTGVGVFSFVAVHVASSVSDTVTVRVTGGSVDFVGDPESLFDSSSVIDSVAVSEEDC